VSRLCKTFDVQAAVARNFRRVSIESLDHELIKVIKPLKTLRK
jgi:hypothetical protein